MPEHFNNGRSNALAGTHDRAVLPSRRLLAQVAASMGVPRTALPILSELFAEQRSLGATPRRVTNWLIGAGVGPRSRVIDLGCGKGSVALSIARRSGAEVRGVDAFPPFIAEARRRAASLRPKPGRSAHAEFVLGDLWSERTPRSRRYDAVIMLNIASTTEALPLIQRLLKPGGVCVLDDAVDVSGLQGETRVRDAPPQLAEVRDEFLGRGFEILRERVFTRAEVRASVAGVTQSLVRAARAIRQREPELHTIARACVENHRAAGALLSGTLRPVLWMLRRAT